MSAVQLLTDGAGSSASRMLLREKLGGARVPLHVVAFNVSDDNTASYLRDLAKLTGGRYRCSACLEHAVSECDFVCLKQFMLSVS